MRMGEGQTCDAPSGRTLSGSFEFMLVARQAYQQRFRYGLTPHI